MSARRNIETMCCSFNTMRRSSKRLWHHLGAPFAKMRFIPHSHHIEVISERPQEGRGEAEQEPAIWPEPWNGPFRFFDLPTELRIRIYQHALVEVRESVDQSNLVVRMKNTPNFNALNVNRLFGREYFHEAKKQTHLVIDDNASYKWQFVKLQSCLLQYVKTLEVHIRTVWSFLTKLFTSLIDALSNWQDIPLTNLIIHIALSPSAPHKCPTPLPCRGRDANAHNVAAEAHEDQPSSIEVIHNQRLPR